jgi:cell division protein FtsI (penicillin-binding protein 3)
VFRSVTQQVLAYLHVPQDVEPHNVPKWLALRAASEKQDDTVAEGSPDRLSWSVEAEGPAASSAAKSAPAETHKTEEPQVAVMEASFGAGAPRETNRPTTPAAALPKLPIQGTTVLDAEGGILVPSFVGQRLRDVVQKAQQAGVEIDVIGTGIAREQAPPAGSRIPAGTRVAVRLSR